MYGKDLRDDAVREEMRQHMGVCPQHDILYDVLTVREHIALFAAIKGTFKDPQTETFANGAELLKEIGLVEKGDARANGLSGGQKRKLSVGLALMGNPKVLALDEPSSGMSMVSLCRISRTYSATTGMDPASRRKLWSLLQKFKPGRVTLLTTHYLQEVRWMCDNLTTLQSWCCLG